MRNLFRRANSTAQLFVLYLLVGAGLVVEMHMLPRTHARLCQRPGNPHQFRLQAHSQDPGSLADNISKDSRQASKKECSRLRQTIEHRRWIFSISEQESVRPRKDDRCLPVVRSQPARFLLQDTKRMLKAMSFDARGIIEGWLGVWLHVKLPARSRVRNVSCSEATRALTGYAMPWTAKYEI